MDRDRSKPRNKYERVMPRLYTRSRSNLEPRSLVTRHENPSSRLGAKSSVSNLSSNVFTELPTVLNDYTPEEPVEKPVKRSSVVKPRRTLKSLDPEQSPLKARVTPARPRDTRPRKPNSAPAVPRNAESWSEQHVRQCHSSRSHTQLKELKDEINSFRETEKLLHVRARLYKKHGVVLDDIGQPLVDRGVQAEPPEDHDKEAKDNRSEQRSARSYVGASLPDQQMRVVPRYPVDRYLVESSKKFEMANVIEDDFWQLEPTLKPEDEMLLRRLHEMLQSTADDLKVLSGELIRLHEPGIQLKTPAMPLDDEFNDRVHIEEVVNAKFNGHKIIDSTNLEDLTLKEKINNKKFQKIKKPIVTTNAGMQTNSTSVLKKNNNKNLSLSKLRTVQIEASNNLNTRLKQQEKEEPIVVQTVCYNEFSHEYEPKPEQPRPQLQVQRMPSINIRSELKEQKVLQLDIIPEIVAEMASAKRSNVTVIDIQYEDPKPLPQSIARVNETKYHQPTPEKGCTRKLTKMSTCESSESYNSDTLHKLTTQILLKPTVRISPKNVRNKKHIVKKEKKEVESKRTHFNLDEWKKKLNSVYGQPLSARRIKCSSQTKSNIKKSPKTTQNNKSHSNVLNNSNYIPYSQLTLGGVRLSDIERELSDGPIKNDIPLSPILDKILSSRENSFQIEGPRNNKQKSPRVLSTSDENLLQEVIDIEKSVSKTLFKNDKILKESPPKSQNTESDLDETQHESYADDFEEENKPDDNISRNTSKESSKNEDDATDKNQSLEADNSNTEDVKNTTYIKSSNLSLKNTVDIYEFIHSVDTQDNATQSQNTQTISLKETQTSPTNETPTIQPIHNDLWSARSIDPKGDIEQLFKLEKDFIKKLIIDEYGDALEKAINKPSTSKDCNDVNIKCTNIVSSQKITQTSPTHVKSIMTSPTKTKTRTTSPFTLNLMMDHPTSPLELIQEDKVIQTEPEEQNDEPDELGITINLSSPRFSLKLPQSSHEVLSNLELCSQPSAVDVQEKSNEIKPPNLRKPTSSSTSIDADASSSEISSLGEVKFKLKRRLRRNRQHLSSESSSTSVISRSEFSGGILPLKSDGEVGSSRKKSSSDFGKTDEESFGQI